MGKNFSGEGGIRTLGSRKGYNGFRDRPDRPLWHLSKLQASIILEFNSLDKPGSKLKSCQSFRVNNIGDVSHIL